MRDRIHQQQTGRNVKKKKKKKKKKARSEQLQGYSKNIQHPGLWIYQIL